MAFTSTNPGTGEQVAVHPSLDAAARERLLAEVHSAQHTWRRIPLELRGAYVRALAEGLRERREALADALTLEMGKPVTAARAEVDKCIALCEQAPEAAARALASETVVDDDTALVRVEYQPLGTILAIMPWNFPYWQALRFAVPALMAGNGVLIKPAGSVAGSALLLERVFRAAGERASAHAGAGQEVPVAPLHMALVDVEDIEGIIADPRIVGVTLTGSDRAGRAVARAAGAHLKKVVLELGGSDPFIVLPSAEIERAATTAAAARTVNSGQSCIAAKRFIVCEPIYDAFMARFTAEMQSLTMGDPRDERTQVGPIATEAVRDDLARQVRESVAHGAQVVLGGSPEAVGGFYYPPTILTDIPDDAPAAREELFGPVASVFRVHDLDEAIARANATPFGLGASVWSSDAEEIERCIAELDAGMVFINDMVVSDARYPFGGVKQSGVGRELGAAGYREFTNIKTVRIARSPGSRSASLGSERIVAE
jgi:succinate-semialdehyde dehydrogenase / glutarate-semialdehyde dehydrogenase